MKLGMLAFRRKSEELGYVEASRITSITWLEIQGEGLPQTRIRLDNGEHFDAFDSAGKLAAEYDGLISDARGDKQ